MNHGISHKKFSRRMGHRKSLFKNLCKSLIEHEQIITTLAKAKAVRPIAEKLVTSAKTGTLHSRRKIIAYIGDNSEAKKLFEVLANRYKQRPGGYLRILKAGFRAGDSAPVAVLEFVDRDASAKGAKNKAAIQNQK